MIVTVSTSGNSITGAGNGSFTCGFTVGASKVCTVGSVIFKEIACLVTSFGEIRASISTSLVGSFKSFKSTNPQLLFPLVDEFIELSLSIFTPPFDELFAFFQEFNESFPGVNGAPPTLVLSRVSIAFLTFQLPLVYIPLKTYFCALSPLPLYSLPQWS